MANKEAGNKEVANKPNHTQDLPPSLIADIQQIIHQARTQVKQAVNHTMVQAYWQIGQLIVEQEQQGEQRAEYGKAQLQQLSEQLTSDFGKGFDITNLRNMRRFYQVFPIRDALRLELSWTHYRALMRIENEQARNWYMTETQQQAWSARALERQIGTLYYERLLSSKEKPRVEQEAHEKIQDHEKQQALANNPKDYLRDPYLLDFLNLDAGAYLESDLEQGIISNIQQFLLELGKGFAFVERQQRIITDDGDYFIDLVFYNFHLKCFLLIDLKLHKLSHQDVGQMDMYVRMYEDQRRQPDDNPTIGLILCSEGNNTVAKYSVLNESQQLFASKYVTQLPSEEELRIELEKERAQVQQQLQEKNTQ